MKKISIIILGMAMILPAYSQHKVNLEFRAGMNIGGAAPVPLPEEIREIKSFNPNLNPSVEADAIFTLDKKGMFEIVTGLRFERKSMTTDAGVKDYGMELIGEQGEIIAGRWTGDVNTKYSSYHLTLPVLFSINPCRNLSVQVGPYISYQMSGQFDGYVSNGYLRHIDPTGEKFVFEGDTQGRYDFSNNLHNLQYGAMLGVDWELSKHLVVAGHLSWSFRHVFDYGFNTMTFNLYPIYLNVSVGYRLFARHTKRK